MRALALAIVFALAHMGGSAQAQTGGDPAGVMSNIYKAYQASSNGPKLSGVYSRRLKGLLDADERNTPKGEIGRLEFDPFVDGQDWKITKLRITPVSQSAAKAQVRAQFDNLGQASDLMFDLVRENGRWVVDDVRSNTPTRRWTLSKILTGAPDAFPDAKN